MAGSLADMPHAWLPESRPLSNALVDNNPRSYELFEIDTQFDPVSFGLEFGGPTKAGCVEVDFASLGGRVYEPSPSATRLEALVGDQWKVVPADLSRNYEQVGALAKHQGRGWSTWQLRFEPITVKALRLVANASSHTDPGFRCIVPSRFSSFEIAPKVLPSTPIPYLLPQWLEPGADLAQGAKQSRGLLTWGKPVLINKLIAKDLTSAEYQAGTEWLPVPIIEMREGEIQFKPIATKAIRAHARGKVQAYLNQEGKRYFEAVERSRIDLLGERFRTGGTLDLASMESLLLPIDFSLTAIGRPADLHETILNWAGLFLMVEASACEARDGKALPVQALDRWFLPIVDGKQLADDLMATESHYLNGWMPATVTRCGDGEQTMFVTAPGAPIYANIAQLKVKNPTTKAKTCKMGYAMGRRRLYNANDEPWTPFLSDPQPTGYTLDSDRQTVRNRLGEIVFWSPIPGDLTGTDYEAQFEVELTIASRSSVTVGFVMPSVDEPLKTIPKTPNLKELQQGFERYWTQLMAGVATVDIPEKPMTNLVKNLLAQSLIITLDGDVVRYGAYFYEAYFGIEEGWPAVALAQFGFADEAKRILRTMLQPAFMSKGDYHHQYRNGLDPWYAITIGRLGQDDAWLNEILPIAKECADWTVKVTNENKDANWGGTLPKHIYGGDIGMPAYSFYSNATCWRGLKETAWLCSHLGEGEKAKGYVIQAGLYHKRLLELADNLVDRSNGAAFLPMSFDLDTPSGHREKEPSYPFLASHTTSGDTWGYVGNYWNLFAPMLLEVRLFDLKDERSRWIPDYMEQRGGILTGMARFDLGYDAIYGKGYMESLLEMGRRDEFLTSLYGMIAHGMSRNSFSCPEVSGVFPLRVDNLAMYREHERERWNFYYRGMGQWLAGWENQEGEPLSAGPGMTLQLIRMALVREDNTEDPPTKLLLLDGAPSHWFAKGKHLEFKDLRTFFGKASVRVDSYGDRYVVQVQVPAVECTLRLPHPGGKHLERVEVNGKTFPGFSGDEIRLPADGKPMKIEAWFR